MARFPKNDIMSLVGEKPRWDLAESFGPNLHLGDLVDDVGDVELGYGSAEGDYRLREAIAHLHGVGPDDVVITVGGMHALFLLAFILSDRGDDAVTTTPMFPPARAALDVVGAHVHALRLSFDRGYRLDLADLASHLSERTKLVSLASPQNPSGVAIPPSTLRGLVALMAEKSPHAYLLLDETYREAAYGNDAVAASAVGLSPKVISCASLSKCHGAPGLRLGWAITRDRALRDQLVVGKFSTVISCSPVDEALALRVLAQREHILAARRAHLAEGLARTAAFVQTNARFVDWVRPDAGALCCVRLKPAVYDETAVRRFYDMLASEGVRVANGTWFGEDARVFRLGFGLLSIPDLDVALESLARALARAERRVA